MCIVYVYITTRIMHLEIIVRKQIVPNRLSPLTQSNNSNLNKKKKLWPSTICQINSQRFIFFRFFGFHLIQVECCNKLLPKQVRKRHANVQLNVTCQVFGKFTHVYPLVQNEPASLPRSFSYSISFSTLQPNRWPPSFDNENWNEARGSDCGYQSNKRPRRHRRVGLLFIAKIHEFDSHI